jgi:tetratricopeptide (TPR) repeat protein
MEDRISGRKQGLRFILLLCTASVATTQPKSSQNPQPASTGPSTHAQEPSSVSSGAATAANAPAPSRTSLLTEAMALYRKGDFGGAIAKYQEVLQQNPKSPDAYAGIVRCHLQRKEVNLAAQAAEKGLAVSSAPRIRVAQAEVLFREGKINEAETEWVSVIRSGFPEPRAYLGLARVRQAIAMYKTAETFIQKAHELDPEDPDIQERWVETLSRAERIKYLERTLAGENNWDEDRREANRSYLEYLKERSNRKTPPCRLNSNVATTEAPLVRLLLDPQHLRGYGLAVELNGHRSSLMLDTGASGILVRRGIAEKAGISRIAETKVWGIGKKGARSAYFGIADTIRVGNLEFHNCSIQVMESRSVAGEDGLIGADVFEDFLVDLDLPNEKLKLSPLPKRPGEGEKTLALKNEEEDSEEVNEGKSGGNSKTDNAKTAVNAAPASRPRDRYIAPEMQTFSRIYRFGHDLLVPTKIGDVPDKLFLLDTGAWSNSISPAAAREVTKVHGDPDMKVEGISGSVDKVFSANRAVLQFGHLRQENQDMTAFDTTSVSEDVGTEVSGFLGFTLLRFLDIKIDYRDALVDFTFDRDRWHF